MAIRKGNKRGFTLIELMIVVAIVGVLAALAIYGVSKYLASSKTAEARTALGNMAKAAKQAYEREGMAATVLALGEKTGITHRLCGAAAATVPAAIGDVAGKKYQSSPSEWNAGDAQTGWQCLKFTMTDPQYYLYDYNVPGGVDSTGDTFDALAQGDLDGDGTPSTFTYAGKIQEEGGQLVLTLATKIEEVNPEE